MFLEFRKLLSQDRTTFDVMGVVANFFIAIAVPTIALFTMVLSGLIIYKNFKMDPFYLAFAYFAPPDSEPYKKWYNPTLHAAVVSILGFPYFLEGIRTFDFNVLNDIIGAYCSINCLRLVEASINAAPAQMTMAGRLENGIKLYDAFYIIASSGRHIQSLENLLILGLGYAILMFNAAATVTAWDVLPIEVAWAPPVVTFLCILMLVVVLPIPLECCSRSGALLRRWTNLAKQTRSTRCVRKQLHSRLPVTYLYGQFKKMNPDFRLEYLESIMERTSNQILVYNSGGTFSI